MDLKALENMDPDGLREYVKFLLYHYQVVDAFWFIRTEEEYGLPVAEHLNERVWGKAGQLGARRLIKQLGIEEKGLAGFRKALSLFPWALIVGYEIKDHGDELVIEVPCCPSQAGRARHGNGEYACKEMHRAEFEGFAHEIDPDIRVICDFAPPDPHPEDMHCRWRFTMQSDDDDDK